MTYTIISIKIERAGGGGGGEGSFVSDLRKDLVGSLEGKCCTVQTYDTDGPGGRCCTVQKVSPKLGRDDVSERSCLTPERKTLHSSERFAENVEVEQRV